MTPQPFTEGASESAYHFLVAAITRGVGLVSNEPALLERPIMVTFNVNGIDLPFARTLEDVYSRFHAMVDERARELNAMRQQELLEPLRVKLRDIDAAMTEVLKVIGS